VEVGGQIASPESERFHFIIHKKISQNIFADPGFNLLKFLLVIFFEGWLDVLES